jgi:GR25 family glycosyltransferase involved in LPS biosynthesis
MIKTKFKLLFKIILFIVFLYLMVYFYQHKEKFTNKNKVIERDDFDCYVINMKKNKDRLDYIQNIYNLSDLNTVKLIRIEAVNGKDINIEPYVTQHVYKGIQGIERTNQRHHHSQITRGAIGCYLSHLKLYDLIQKSEKPYALVLEDDAKFNPDIYKSGIQNILNDMPEDWDIILLGRMQHDVINKEKYLIVQRFWGTWGYLISQKGIKNMLKYGNIPIDDQIDAVMGKLSREGKLKIYAPFHEFITMNNSFQSEIQMHITEKKDIDPNTDPYL